jgi:phytoene desaturase
MSRTIVVGAGLGGLSVAIRLAAAGWQVSVYEKNDQPGGRMSTVSAGGYTWDVGPTLIMMPEVLRELFEAAGRRLEDYVELLPLDPYYRVAFEEGGHLDFTGHLPTMLANLEALEPGSGAGYLRFLAQAERLSHVTRTSIIGRAYSGLRDLTSLSVLASLLRARPFASVASTVAAHFTRSELRRAFSFQTLYLGTRPEETPAAYVMIPFVEATLGVWYPRGGIHRIALAMARLAGELGVELHLDTPVAEILTEGGRAVGVRLAHGGVERADVVVSNAEWGYTQQRLLADGERVAGRRYGCSGVLFLMAVRGPVEGPHHTFILSGDFEGNLADIFQHRRLPAAPSIYVSRATASDPGMAGDGVELLYVLVPCPTLESDVDWAGELPGFRKVVFDRLTRIGLEGLDDRIVAETVLTPEDFASRYNLENGSAFGLAATLFQSGPFRPTIRSARYPNLFHVGASSHPGGGVPIVMLSGRLVAEAVEREFGPVPRRAAGRLAAGVAKAGAWSGAASS